MPSGKEGRYRCLNLYCDLLSQPGETIANLMGAIRKQLVGRGGISNYPREAFQKAKVEFDGRGPLLAGDAITSLPRVFIRYVSTP